MSAYRFRLLAPSDLPLVRHWRHQPHVVEWWGPPEVESEEEKLADGKVRMWIVEHEDHAFAYAQDYSPHDWLPHPFAHLPPGSRGIDQFIGEASMLDQGHGSRFVRQHSDMLLAEGAPAVGTDPHPNNARAIAAYRKAGFALASEPLDTRWGRAILMERWQSV